MTQFGRRETPSTFGKRVVHGRPSTVPELSPKAKAFIAAQKAQPKSSDMDMLSSMAASTMPVSVHKVGDKPVIYRRMLSYLIDSMIVAVPFWLIFGSMFQVEPMSAVPVGTIDVELAPAIAFFKSILAFFLVRSLYSITMEASTLQATVGKMMMGTIVTDNERGKPSLGQVIMRNTFGRVLSNIVPLGLGYGIAVTSARKKCLHDTVAGTMVCTRGVSNAAALSSQVFA